MGGGRGAAGGRAAVVPLGSPQAHVHPPITLRPRPPCPPPFPPSRSRPTPAASRPRHQRRGHPRSTTLKSPRCWGKRLRRGVYNPTKMAHCLAKSRVPFLLAAAARATCTALLLGLESLVRAVKRAALRGAHVLRLHALLRLLDIKLALQGEARRGWGEECWEDCVECAGQGGVRGVRDMTRHSPPLAHTRTFSPSLRKRKPMLWMTLWWTKTAWGWGGGAGGGRVELRGWGGGASRSIADAPAPWLPPSPTRTIRLRRVIGGDEAEALGEVEPLHRACRAGV